MGDEKPKRKSLDERRKEHLERVKDVESSALQLAEDLKYPVDAYGNVLDMNHLPDVSVTLVHHLIRRGWRPNQSKALIKPRRIIGGGYYEDLVTYVGINEPDEPIVMPQSAEPAADPEIWSVKPKVNMLDEERPKE